MRVLLITTDAFGGHGGIAQYNRDLVNALAVDPDITEIVAIPRNVQFALGNLPAKLQFRSEAAGGKMRFILSALLAARGRFDLLVCGHVNLMPLAALLKQKLRAPLVMMAYGIDVWEPHHSRLVRNSLRRADAIWSISEITRDKLLSWSELEAQSFVILPNAISLERYGPGPKSPRLLERYGLSGKKIIMILCRLPAAERYKGVDEILELMPRMLVREPRLAFLVAGEGNDQPRLERKADALGIHDHVVFTGFVQEHEKVDHYRLADAFVMPGRREGFGFVILEALACGVPVVASKIDGSREAVRGGELGRLVNPDNPDEIEEAVFAALSDGHRVPEGLSYFSFSQFSERVLQAAHAAAGR